MIQELIWRISVQYTVYTCTVYRYPFTRFDPKANFQAPVSCTYILYINSCTRYSAQCTLYSTLFNSCTRYSVHCKIKKKHVDVTVIKNSE